MKTISGAFSAHLGLENTSLASIWRVIRIDGKKFFFTDLDGDKTFNGDKYLAAFGYDRSDVVNKVGLNVDELDVRGFLDLSVTGITEADLRAGLFDFAEVFLALINWRDLTQGELLMRRGHFGEVTFNDSGLFEVELRGLTQAYSQGVLELYQGECRADLGDDRCKVPIDPPFWVANTVYALGAEVKFPVADVVTEISITNGGFETDAVGATTITGWTTVLGTPIIASSSGSISAAKVGAKFVEGNGGAGGSTTTIEQIVSLTGTYSNAQLDGGQLVPYVQGWRNASAADDTTQYIMRFLDGADVELGDVTGDAAHFLGVWDDERVGGIDPATKMPVGTRKIAIRIVFALVTGTFPNGAADDVHLFVRERDTVSGLAQLGDRVFRAVTAGTSDEHFPPFITTIDATIVEVGRLSQMQWNVDDAFLRQAVVATVTDERNFTITVAEARAVDDWFRFGAVIWETGNNALAPNLLSMEIKSSGADATTGATTLAVDDSNTFSRATGSFVTDGFEVGMKVVTTGFTDGANNGTFTVQTVSALTLDVSETTLVAESGTGDELITAPDAIELYLDMPFTIQVGDRLKIYRGCDKFLSTCITPFDNAINFRGEPFVPGQGEFLSAPANRGA